jgi:hypothetical protein
MAGYGYVYGSYQFFFVAKSLSIELLHKVRRADSDQYCSYIERPLRQLRENRDILKRKWSDS